jgi:ADP-ribose pyrophosphatase
LPLTNDESITPNAASQAEVRVVAQGRFLDLVCRGRWEFVQRRNATGVVLVVAVTPHGKLLLVEQYRPPVDSQVIELPAGLVNDQVGISVESCAEAARRELLEETGYDAGQLREIFSGPSSAGLTDEQVSIFLATGLQKVHAGGGVENENIVVHEVPLSAAFEWLDAQHNAGRKVDVRVYAGIHIAAKHLT